MPATFERIVRHCLEKRPDDRFQSARDLVFDLESVAAASSGIAFEGAVAKRSRRQLLPLLAAAGLGGAVALGGALLNWPPAAEPVFKQVTFRRGSIAEARFAPDGQTVIYGAVVEGRHNRLFSARLGSAEVRPLDLPEGEIAGISASGEMAIILSRSYWGRVPGTLARVSSREAHPASCSSRCPWPTGVPTDQSLAVVRHDGPKPRLEFPIGKVLYVGDSWIRSPRVSPKGDLVAFRADEGADCKVKVVDLSGKATTLATATCALGLAWSPSGEEVWFTEWEVIRAVTLGGKQRVLTRFPGRPTLNDVSADGRVLVTTAQWYNGLVFAGPGDTKERDLAWFEFATLGALSRDGRFLLFSDRGSGTGPPYPVQTYLRRTDGAPAVRLGEGQAVSLSPDGKWGISVLGPGIAGTRPVGGTRRCLLLPTGPGEPRPLPVGDLECEYASWFPDGKRLLVVGSEAGVPGASSSKISREVRGVLSRRTGLAWARPLESAMATSRARCRPTASVSSLPPRLPGAFDGRPRRRWRAAAGTGDPAPGSLRAAGAPTASLSTSTPPRGVSPSGSTGSTCRAAVASSSSRSHPRRWRRRVASTR